MSYGAKYRFTHYDINNVKWEIDILEDGYASSVTEKKLTGDMFTLTYESGAIKEGRLEMQFLLEGSADRTIAEGLVGQGDTKYICKLKKAGSDYWQGYLVSDLVEITEGDYPGVATITAKDLLSLNQEFARDTDITVANYDKLIELFAEVLPFDIGIRTYTDWTQSNISAGDFLNQIYVDRYAFRQVNPGTDDTNLTQKQVLENLLFATDTQLIQSDGVWQLMQRDNLDKATYTRYNYLASGAQGSPASTSSVNLDQTVDGSTSYVLPASTAYWVGGLKRNGYKYLHRSKTYGIQFEDTYNLGSGQEAVEEQFFISDGTQQIRIQFSVETRVNASLDYDEEATFNVEIRSGSSGNYVYWDGSTWSSSATDVQNLSRTGRDFGTFTIFKAFYTITTDAVPDPNDGTLRVTLREATTSASVEYTIYRDLSFDIFTGTDANDSAELIYSLTNNGGFSVAEDYGTSLLGEGPTPTTRGATRYSSGGAFPITLQGWTRSGLTENLGLERLILRSRMDYYRRPRKTLRGEIWGSYDAHKILSWDSKRWAFERGTLVGLTGQWRSTFFIEINPETASSVSQTDTFNTLAVEVTGGGEAGSSSFETGEVDTTGLNALYLQKANNLSDVANTATARQNLDLEIGVDVQAYDADLTAIAGLTPTDSNIIVGNGTTWVAESGATARTSLGLGTGDSPTFAGLDVNGEIIASTSGLARLTEFDNSRGGAGLLQIRNRARNDWTAGDLLGRIAFYTEDTSGIGVRDVAKIESYAGAGNTFTMGGALSFHVSALNANTFEAMRITSAGNVGINQTNPAYKLDVNGSLGATTLNTGQGDNELYAMDQDVRTTDSPTFAGLTVDTDTLYVDSANNRVGIGTTSPAGKLNVSGDGLWITDNTTAYIVLRSGNSSSSGANIALASGDLTFVTRTTSNTERMRITSTGNVGIGTTSPSGKFEIRADGFTNLFSLGGSTTADIGYLTFFSNSSPNRRLILGGIDGIDFNTGAHGSSTTYARLTSGGDVQNPSFSAGFSGSKWQITEAGSAEFDSLTVRGSLKAYELIVKQISTIGGTEILSVAQGKVEAVNTGSGVITVQSVSGSPAQPFTTDDVVMIQTSNMEKSGEAGIGFTIRRIVFTIASISSNTITIDSILSGSVTDIQEGDVMVVIGSNDSQRNALMYRNVDRKEDRLITRVQVGTGLLADLTDESKTRIAYGDIGDYLGTSYSETFGFFAGTLSARHSLITPSGFFLKNGTTTLAALEADGGDTRFRIGDDTNYLRYSTASGGSFSLKASTFDISSTGLAIKNASVTVPTATVYVTRTLVDQVAKDTTGSYDSLAATSTDADQLVSVKYDIKDLIDLGVADNLDLSVKLRRDGNVVKENTYQFGSGVTTGRTGEVLYCVTLASGESYDILAEWTINNKEFTLDFTRSLLIESIPIGMDGTGLFTRIAGDIKPLLTAAGLLQ